MRATFGLWRVDVPNDWEVIASDRCCARLSEAPALSIVFDHDAVDPEQSLESYIAQQRTMLALMLGSAVDLEIEEESSPDIVRVKGTLRAVDGATLNASQLYVRRGKYLAVLTCMTVSESIESVWQALDTVLRSVVLCDLEAADGSEVAFSQLEKGFEGNQNDP
jgi:hypothetical protein